MKRTNELKWNEWSIESCSVGFRNSLFWCSRDSSRLVVIHATNSHPYEFLPVYRYDDRMDMWTCFEMSKGAYVFSAAIVCLIILSHIHLTHYHRRLTIFSREMPPCVRYVGRSGPCCLMGPPIKDHSQLIYLTYGRATYHRRMKQ